MKSVYKLAHFSSLALIILFLLPTDSWSQEHRIKPPKKKSKIESVDLFVNHSFELYHKVFVYDSLVKAGIEVPTELEDELMERAERDVDSLMQVVPDIAEDISDAPFLKQAKATFNLNRTKNALKFCIITVKAHIIGTEEEDEEND